MARSTLSWSLALILVAFALPAFPQETGTLTGYVRRATTGAPLSDVQVQITSADGGHGGTATSGLDGLYVFSGLAPGYYYARTSNSQGFVDELYHEMPCPSWCTASAGTPILVSAGAAAGSVDFTLQAAARVTGSVTDAATGTPLADVSVWVLTVRGEFLASGTTAPDGSYSIALPHEGQYLVRTYGRGYVSELFDDVMCQPQCDLSQATAVVLAFDTVRAGIDFALVAGGSVTGRVVDAATTLPLAEAVVRVLDGGGGTRAYARTDADGRYTALGLATGTYRVRAQAEDYLGEAYDNVPCPRLECPATTGAAVQVTLATTTAGIDFALTRTGGRIEGTVTDGTTSGPIGGAFIEVLAVNGSVVTGSGTDAAGRYSARGLSSGTYFVRTRNSAGYMDELYDDVPCPGDSCSLSSGRGVTVAVGATSGGVDFALTPGGQVTGVVTAQDTGQPLVSASVSLYDGEGRSVRNVFTEQAGTYAFGGLSAGTYFVRTSNVADDYLGELFDDLPCP
nr:carboxypeptidase regulatory-like domain-containing protein [Vicinamibacterales bacterium]